MSRIHDVIHRYNACRAVLKHGVDIFAVGDPAGARLNAAVRRALYQVDEDNRDVWGDLIRAANAVRWRRVTQPQPNASSPALSEAVASVLRAAKLLRSLVGDESLVDEVADAATAVGDTDSPVGAELLRSVKEVGTEACVVVARNGFARAGVHGWLEQFGVRSCPASGVKGFGRKFPRRPASLMEGAHVRVQESIARRASARGDR